MNINYLGINVAKFPFFFKKTEVTFFLSGYRCVINT
jgi:hypothetical protein